MLLLPALWFNLYIPLYTKYNIAINPIIECTGYITTIAINMATLTKTKAKPVFEYVSILISPLI